METQTITLANIYAVTAILSLLLLICVCNLHQKKGVWLILLYASVFIVNAGYFALSISRSLEEALLANRISYLGSVFLPLAMEMIILNTTRLKYRRWIPGVLIVISLAVFFVAASPGYLDIYYQEVTLETVNGSSILNKVYGPWHNLYPIFLASYFSVMLITIAAARRKKKPDSAVYSSVMLMAVLVNICVWGLEQLISINFEFLSVSYIISELFLIGSHLLVNENLKLKEMVAAQTQDHVPAGVQSEDTVNAADTADLHPHPEHQPAAPTPQQEIFLSGLKELTPTEQTIYDLYVNRHTTREILDLLNIKENTLKFHNKNIYGKLNVTSRKQLVTMHEEVKYMLEEAY